VTWDEYRRAVVYRCASCHRRTAAAQIRPFFLTDHRRQAFPRG
jgi:hypothetical protein